MSNLTIGRAGFDLELASLSEVSVTANSVRLAGNTWGMDFESAQILREQLVAYQGISDESFLPVTSVDMPSMDGYYRDPKVSVTASNGRAHAGVFDFSIDLERVGGFAAPLIEVRSTGALRVNSQSVVENETTGAPGASRAWVEYSPSLNVYFGRSRETRLSSTGDVSVFSNSSESFKQFYVAPEHFYDGAASLYMGDLASVVVGRQIRNTPDEWILSNGIVRVRPDYTGDVFGLLLEAWTGSAWGTSWKVELLGGNPRDYLENPHTITVLRNAPEEVRLRFQTVAVGEGSPIIVDMSLRRGMRFVSMRTSMSIAGSNNPGVNTTGFNSATDLAGGWGNGTQIVGGPLNIGKTSSTMYAYEGSIPVVDRWDFMLAVLPTTATTGEMNSVIAEYMWAVEEVQTVVAR